MHIGSASYWSGIVSSALSQAAGFMGDILPLIVLIVGILTVGLVLSLLLRLGK